ncbi:MAG: hypothetical protein FHK80_00345 [Azoarcus sp. PHD]|nr:MAG: hypothetical protein FHK80_00345 [Azoarcus sp. PHD]
MNDRIAKPPYTSYRSFENLIKEFRDHEVLPDVIDRSYLSKRSGSEQSALIATLKWFGLVDEASAPTNRLRDYVAADDAQSKVLLKEMVVGAYSLMTDDAFNLRGATTAQMADRFRQYEISGSTLTKSVGFFLAAAKDAGISVSPHVKPPAATPNGAGKRKPKTGGAPLVVSGKPPLGSGGEDSPQGRPDRTGTITIPIPIFGMQDGAIYLPEGMNERQWKSVISMTEFILRNYRDTMPDAPGAEEEDL